MTEIKGAKFYFSFCSVVIELRRALAKLLVIQRASDMLMKPHALEEKVVLLSQITNCHENHFDLNLVSFLSFNLNVCALCVNLSLPNCISF